MKCFDSNMSKNKNKREDVSQKKMELRIKVKKNDKNRKQIEALARYTKIFSYR